MVETLNSNNKESSSCESQEKVVVEAINLPVIQIDEVNENNKESGSKDDHFNPSVRIVIVPKLPDNSCGFHLSRSKWDPYPYVSGIDKDSPAEYSGVKIGDCVLEVNSEDVLGLRILEVANLVKSKSDHVSLLLWSANLEPVCNPDSICCGPMPISLEKLASSMQSIIQHIECPVCLDTIPPPVTQCQNGHILCLKCRARSDKCPICRDRYSLARCLLAEHVYTSLVQTFNLEEVQEGSMREKIFGAKAIPAKAKVRIDGLEESQPKIHSHTQKFLARLMGKANSVDNLNQNINRRNMINSNGVLKHSVSTSEISRADSVPIAVRRCPSSNSRVGNELSSSLGSLQVRRPVSCNASSESLPSSLPRIVEEKYFKCPAGISCEEKVRESSLTKHINLKHGIPSISFGTSSAEIALPPKTPIDNASLILVEDSKQFWLRLIVDPNNDLFISCLMQSTNEDCSNYALEVIIRKSNGDKILGKELITRNKIYCLENKSWQEIYSNREGIFYTNESIETTFPMAEVLLKASIRRMSDI